MNTKEQKKYSLLAEVACDYYERSLNQDEIAEKIGLSRTRVSRLLKKAEELGIVRVTVNYTFERHYELEERLKEQFPLRNVRVLNNRIVPRDAIAHNVHALAARYIMETLRKDMLIGTGWGTTMTGVVQNLQPALVPVQVVQLMGAVFCRSANHTPQGMVSAMSEILQCKGDFLNLPLYIEDDYVREAMYKDKNIDRVLKQGLFSDMTLSSISDLDHISERDIWLGYMTPQMLQEAIDQGAVGAIFARFFDKNGEEVDCSWNRRCVSISLKHVREVPNTVVVACGKEKASAVRYAIRSGLVNTLITDGTTASAILGISKVVG